MPVLISAIANILAGLFWLSTCVGVVIAVPMFVLAAFEIAFVAKAHGMSRDAVAGRATVLGICEIVAGLGNLVSLVCAIVVLVNVASLRK